MDDLTPRKRPSPLPVTARCERCGESWTTSSELDAHMETEIAELLRLGNPIAGIRNLQAITDISLKDAKSIYYHVTQENGRCHHCSARLDGKRVTLCESCSCLNYDW